MERDHEKMMRTPEDWPRWPLLPLKNPTTGEFGVLYGLPETGGDVVSFAPVNMFKVRADDLGAKRITDLIADGWEVD